MENKDSLDVQPAVDVSPQQQGESGNKKLQNSLIIIIVAVLCAGGVYYWYGNRKNTPEQPAIILKPMSTIQSKRTVPTVEPIHFQGIRYEVSSMGIILATDEKSNQELWKKEIYKVSYISNLESDVQDIHITHLEVANDTLLVTTEKNVVYTVDLKTGAVLSNSSTPTTATTASSPIDPRAQAIVDRFNQLIKKISPETLKGGFPSVEEEEAMKQISAIWNDGELARYDTKSVHANISADSYAYDFSIAINGKETGLHGDGNTVARLFSSDSLMGLISAQDVRDHNFILATGKNTITITYKRKPTKQAYDNSLLVKLTSYTDDTVVNVTVKNKDQGVIEKDFTLEIVKPSDFKTITVSE